MQEPTKQEIQIYTPKDRLNFALHAAANLAVLGGIVSIEKGGNYLALSAALSSLPFLSLGVLRNTISLARIFSKTTQDNNPQPSSLEPTADEDTSRLQQAANSIATRFKISQIEVGIEGDLVDDPAFINDRYGRYRRSSKRNRLNNNTQAICKYNRVDGKQRILLSRKLVRELAPQKQEAVLGHEIGHAAAKHIFWKAAVNWTGRLAFSESIFHASDVSISNSANPNVTSMFWAAGTVLLAYTCAKLTSRSFSRVCEFQADRLGATVTTPTITQATLTDIYGRRKGTLPEGIMARAEYYLLSSHPTLPQRIVHLKKMEASNG